MDKKKEKVTIFWFRRDLRLEDNAGLYYALKQNKDVIPLFIFDTTILDRLEDKKDRRVDFIHQALCFLDTRLSLFKSSLLIKKGVPNDIFKKLIEEYDIDAVFANHDYEPLAIQRDKLIQEFLSFQHIQFETFKDQVIFEKEEILKSDGKPYTVFTPFSKKWKSSIYAFYLKPYPTEKYLHKLKHATFSAIPSLEQIGFQKTDVEFTLPEVKDSLLENYAKNRDFPSIKGTSRISVHLRFGTISIRELAAIGLSKSETWTNELIWRDFYMYILNHFPHVVEGAFKPQYNFIQWRNDSKDFDAWCNGNTGYPIVDAGMRELNTTGFMHNRVRMIVASFLTKHLLIDWRWGEAYFAEKLLDFDLAANNGGWQWAAGSGCDAAPYFRIFNPYEQTKKFDAELKYIEKWVPEYQEFSYPKPIVDHKFARDRALAVYKKSLQEHN